MSPIINMPWAQNTWVTLDIQNYLANIQENQELISWKYVSNPTNPNFEEMVKHLFPWDAERFLLLNPWSYIASLVDWKISSYYWIPEDQLDYRIDYWMLIETLLTTWYQMLKVSSVDSKWELEAINWSKYYDDGITEMFIEQYKVENKDAISSNVLDTKYYLYVQSFSNNVLKNELFEIQKWILGYWIPVSLDIIPELSWRPDEQIVTETNRLVYKLKAESSLIEKIKSIIYSIERKFAEADKQFQNYMEQFKVFDNIEIPKDATKVITQDWVNYTVTDFNKLWKIVQTDWDNWPWEVKIIKNWNALISEALEFAQEQIRLISAITDIPPIFLWLEDLQWNDSWTAIIKSSWAFYKRIESYRVWTENLFSDVNEGIQKLTLEIDFIWPSIVTSDPSEVIADEILKVDNWFSTQLMSIMVIHWVDEKKAKEIQDEARKDQAFKASLENKTPIE